MTKIFKESALIYFQKASSIRKNQNFSFPDPLYLFHGFHFGNLGLMQQKGLTLNLQLANEAECCEAYRGYPGLLIHDPPLNEIRFQRCIAKMLLRFTKWKLICSNAIIKKQSTCGVCCQVTVAYLVNFNK